MKISEQLKAAKALIDAPHKWTQGVPARDQKENNVPFDSGKACRFCSVGAIWRVNTTLTQLGEFVDAPVRAVLSKAAGMEIVGYNDSHNWEDVMNVWDKAIALAERDEGAATLLPFSSVESQGNVLGEGL